MNGRISQHCSLAAALLVLGGLSGCSSLPGKTLLTPVVDTFEGKYIDTINADIEAARGQEQDGLEAKALNDLQISQGLATMDIGGLVDAPEMLAYLRDILSRVVGVYPYDKPAMEIYIDASDRGTAQATPDAEIYVNLGFLEKVETEGQLAMVLAHEAAHILLNHFSRQDYIDAQRKAVTAGAGLAMIGATVANSDVEKDRSGEYRVNTDVRDTAEKTATLQTSSWLINRVSDHVVNNLWTREQEEEADLLAADLLVKSGYNPRASADLFRLLVELRAEEGTYLDFLKKQQEITFRELGESGDAKAFAGGTVEAVFENIAGAGREAWRRLGFTHIDPADRQERMNTYRKREYQSVKFSKADREAERTNYERAKETRLPAALLAGHHAANEATTALIERRLKDAAALAEKGISGRTADSAHTRTVMANVRNAQRRYDDALLNLQRIAPSELRSRQSYELEMTLHAIKGDYEDALAVTDRAKRKLGTDEPFMPLRIQIQLRRGEVEQAWVEHDRCKEEALSAGIREECAAAMGKRRRPGEETGGGGAFPGKGLFDGIGKGIGKLLPGA
jgi:tetratricopeptide (TPR) repeat protein